MFKKALKNKTQTQILAWNNQLISNRVIKINFLKATHNKFLNNQINIVLKSPNQNKINNKYNNKIVII